MGSPSVIPRSDPRARALLGRCLTLCCAFFGMEALLTFALSARPPGDDAVTMLLRARHGLFSLGKGSWAVYLVAGLLMHAGVAAFMGAALQRLWLRNRTWAVLTGVLLFACFQGALVALAAGKF